MLPKYWWCKLNGQFWRRVNKCEFVWMVTLNDYQCLVLVRQCFIVDWSYLQRLITMVCNCQSQRFHVATRQMSPIDQAVAAHRACGSSACISATPKQLWTWRGNPHLGRHPAPLQIAGLTLLLWADFTPLDVPGEKTHSAGVSANGGCTCRHVSQGPRAGFGSPGLFPSWRNWRNLRFLIHQNHTLEDYVCPDKHKTL